MKKKKLSKLTASFFVSLWQQDKTSHYSHGTASMNVFLDCHKLAVAEQKAKCRFAEMKTRRLIVM